MPEEFSEFTKLEVDLGSIPADAGQNMRTAINVTSGKIARAWTAKLSGSEYLPHIGKAINWDVSTLHAFGSSVIESEIGFDKGGPQGPLGNISEFGTTRTPPRGYGMAALGENESDFEHGLEIAVDEALKRAGL